MSLPSYRGVRIRSKDPALTLQELRFLAPRDDSWIHFEMLILYILFETSSLAWSGDSPGRLSLEEYQQVLKPQNNPAISKLASQRGFLNWS